MNYSDLDLQNHELDFWLKSYSPPFIHEDFYKQFFNFSELSEKKTLEIGCGGAPITDYCGFSNIDLTIADPLIEELIKNEKFKHLSEFKYFSKSLFDLDNNSYEHLVCLNVIDHFNDTEYQFVEKFHSLLGDGGKIWLYYDVRDSNNGNHLAIDNNKLIKKIEEKFTIEKIDDNINPKHRGWSSVNKSIRLIATKK